MADLPEESPDAIPWPKELLSRAFPSARVLVVDYQSAISEWGSTPNRTVKSLEERSEEILEKLRAAQVGKDRPVVFVAHSMGGILVCFLFLFLFLFYLFYLNLKYWSYFNFFSF